MWSYITPLRVSAVGGSIWTERTEGIGGDAGHLNTPAGGGPSPGGRSPHAQEIGGDYGSKDINPAVFGIKIGFSWTDKAQIPEREELGNGVGTDVAERLVRPQSEPALSRSLTPCVSNHVMCK